MKETCQHFTTRIEEMLVRGLDKGKRVFQVVGTSGSTAIPLFLSQNNTSLFSNLPRLVVVSSLQAAYNFEQQLSFFSPEINIHIFRPYDVSLYSGLFPSPEVRSSRANFLFAAAHAKKNDLFVAPISALLQLSAPYHEFKNRCKTIHVGDDLGENFAIKLNSLGYQASPLVEDVGQYSIRGGIIDLFSPAEKLPTRIELFGDQVESIRSFSINDQRSLDIKTTVNLVPIYEFEFSDENIESVIRGLRKNFESRGVLPSEAEEAIRSVSLKQYFPGCEFLLPLFFDRCVSPLEHFSSELAVFILDPSDVSRSADEFMQELQSDFLSGAKNLSLTYAPPENLVFQKYESVPWPKDSLFVNFSNLAFLDEAAKNEERISYLTNPLTEFSQLAQNLPPGSEAWIKVALPKISDWLKSDFKIYVASKNQAQTDRLKSLFDRLEISYEAAQTNDFLWSDWQHNRSKVTFIPRSLNESSLLHEEKIVFLRSDDFFGKKQRLVQKNSYENFSSKAKSLSFGDLKPQDLVVHIKHGIGIYEGLKVMNIGGADSEFIQLSYKDKDKLYLPVYRVGQLQKFSGGGQSVVLDKLGGIGWEKTKIKVKAHLKDIAAELLQLYARRSEITRPPFALDEVAYNKFESGFPYEETDDQQKSISDIQKDLANPRPMDRLVCGDVGFGKTEVSMRAAFEVVHNKKQVAVLAPTTVLTFQHLETFKKRFAGWNFNIRSLNRFVSAAEVKKTLSDLKSGAVDIVIGTHRLLSKDVMFKNLGLLIIDEEQRFGVVHKEKIKKLKTDVDTLTLSATPIPRTLNMSFSGVRDLSIINTAPVDRLPTRTFISKFDPELIKKAVHSEIARGGQIYFIHNRVQSIYALADDLRKLLPDVRMKIAHGQMSEDELESAMLAFFNHEIDMLICTAIVESGMDVPRANTMFIDQAQIFGLSQLYQLRGRVGRSKARAFCYLLLPKDKKLDPVAQERLKVIQENSALGSGIKIAQYDLELRGAGNILGDDQSGHVNSVGYELYMDLLNEALAEAKGEQPVDRDLDPEINLRIPALIPDVYIADIRIRLSYYKALSEISSQEDLDRIADELKDQFGEIPEPVINLMGLMLIRRQCKDLGVRDISAGLKNISLIFTEKTRLKPETAIQLAMRENKKYSITPDQRLNVRMNTITWSNVHEELNYLLTLI